MPQTLQPNQLTEARQKLADLNARYSELMRDIQHERDRREALKSQSAEHDDPDQLTRRANDLLEGRLDEQERFDLAAADDESHVLHRAISLQHKRVVALESAAHREIRKTRLPEHNEIRVRLIAAAEQLEAAVAQEREFRQQLDREGIHFGDPLQALSHASLFGQGSEQGLFQIWLAEIRNVYR